MPATDTIDFEREFEELVRDLRALPTAAPEHVRESVRALGEPVPSTTRWGKLPGFPWRRSLLVLAPVCVLGLVTAAVIHRCQLRADPRSRLDQIETAKRATVSPGPRTRSSALYPSAPRHAAADAHGGSAPGLRGLDDRTREGSRCTFRPGERGDAGGTVVRRFRGLARTVVDLRTSPGRPSSSCVFRSRGSRTRSCGSPGSAP